MKCNNLFLKDSTDERTIFDEVKTESEALVHEEALRSKLAELGELATAPS